MKERGILFSGEMVRALLEATNPKTQTRRIVKRPKSMSAEDMADAIEAMHRIGVCDVTRRGPCDGVAARFRCPYGKPGDRLWVRETWAYFGGDEYIYQQSHGSVAYRVEDDRLSLIDRIEPPGGRWRPSIFMPRWASRIDLDVTTVRVERLNDISEADAIAEGCASVAEYRELWERINGAGSWAENPWVWVVEFRRAEP